MNRLPELKTGSAASNKNALFCISCSEKLCLHAAKGGVFMNRRGKCNGRTIGAVAIAAGVMIILAMVLPTDFWWFAAGAVLIIGGICFLRRC